MLVVAAALSYGASGRRVAVEAVLQGVLLGAVAVGVGGLLVLAFGHDRAVQAASTVGSRALPGPWRRPEHGGDGARDRDAARAARGGGRSNTDRPGLGAGALALLLGSIAFSGSRGAFAAAFVGLGVYALLAASGRRRLVLTGVAAGLVGLTLAVSQCPRPPLPIRPSRRARIPTRRR